MDTIIELIVGIFEIDPGLGVVFILAAIGFVSTTVLLVVKAVGWTRGAVRQSHTWLRDSGRLTRPDAATPDLPVDPPALVNLLLTRGKISRGAVRATLLDLAARGALTLYQPDGDPEGTVIMNINQTAGEFTPYEERVMREVAAVHRPDFPVRMSSLAILQPAGMGRWHRQFRKEVQADARQRGLTRLDSSIMATIANTGLVPCTVCSFGLGTGGVMVVLIVYVVGIIAVGNQQRVWLSEAGREALARWLGVREWLRAHEVFEDLPASSVVVWGRYLAYGCAMGVARAA